MFITLNIEFVYISGKKNKHTEINELNGGLCKLETKSDIYIKQKNNVFIGLSVKQSKNATKSNYSAQKMLGKEKDEQLTKIYETNPILRSVFQADQQEFSSEKDLRKDQNILS